MATYVAADELLSEVAAFIGTTPDKLTAESPHWIRKAASANTDAYNEIRSRLVGRGYTTAQVDQWDRRAEYNRRIALYFALCDGAALKDADLEAVDKLKRWLDDLDTVVVLIDGEEPELGSGSSGVNYGDMTNSGDTFTDESWALNGGL